MPPLSTDLFDYHLPERLIAQTPADRRDASRLLVVNRATREISHHHFSDLPRFLRAGDTLLRNNAAVLPARLRAVRPTGGQVECFLLRPADGGNLWRCLVKPGKRLPVGATFAHADGEFTGEIVAKDADGSTAVVRLTTRSNEGIVALANRLGAVPLPPYIQRTDDSNRPNDLSRYQTVYADRARQVAVAAPTAGLHFTPELLTALDQNGVGTADVTLHVGLGTFRPITSDTVEAHDIHHELYEMPRATAEKLAAPAGRRIAVGTTTVRTIEHFLRIPAPPPAGDYFGDADIYIFPPAVFRGVDALITNFHQPRSTLLCLVAAFLAPGSTDGIAWLREIYAEAIAREYRFFSYGDAMLIL
ncbi:MAG: tRNA preQ1(34) S-adenosylmethionine ribosyltransferase-isomerase QueA [Opitutaceae bacterium]|nr:tRNA preQ1(34) S-adenosylmethionine ribosyltransferase-isomerase QueA [Opitutaceae bacterium]